MNIYIANPKALYGLLALIPAIIVAIFQYFRFKSAITSFNNISKMHIIRRLIMRMVCFSAAYASIIFALSDPFWGIKPVAVQTNGSAISYVFDISYSMNAEDASINHDTTRLEAASLYAKTLTDNLSGCAISVVLAKGDGFIAVPLTEDLYAVENLIDNLSPNLISTPGTNLDKGIEKAIKSFPTQSSRQSTIILFTDGDETEGKLEQAIFNAASYGIKVIILGFGSEQGAEVISGDGTTKVYTTLKSKEIKKIIENITNQKSKSFENTIKYFNATDSGSMTKVLDIIHPHTITKELGITYEMQPVPRYKLFIIIAIICVVIGVLFAELNIRKPKLLLQGMCLFLGIFTFSSCSNDFSTAKEILRSTLLWYQKDYQEATTGFIKVVEDAENNNNEEMLQYGLFGLASSYIMQDEETAALEKLENISGEAPENIKFSTYYNMGIIAHRHGEYEKATEAFRQALLIDSTNIDAKINLELSLMENTSNSETGTRELSPVSETEYQSSIEDTLFSVIRETEQDRWKNTETHQPKSDILDY